MIPAAIAGVVLWAWDKLTCGVQKLYTVPARQWRAAFPERRVQPCDVGGVDHTTAVRPASECLDACRCPIDNAVVGRDHLPPRVVLDDLSDGDGSFR